MKEKLTNWRWRFANLYWIKPAEIDKPKILFKSRDEQTEVLEILYDKGQTKLAILKARQLGFSTLLSLISLDMALFHGGFTVGIVDQNVKDAEKKLEMAKFAFENLPSDLLAEIRIIKWNGGELSFTVGNSPKSTIYGGSNARGGTHQLLWISEWGAIQKDDPARSDNIADGALPSATQGITIVETTWKGGKSGRLYTEIVEPALLMDKAMRTEEDWMIMFYPWHGDERYQRKGDASQIDAKCLAYFDELEQYGIELVPAQKLWYYKEAWNKRAKRYEEYPSRLAEIFFSPVDGAIYGEYVDEAMISGRVLDYNAARPEFYTFWDIGKADLTTILLIQRVGGQDRIFDGYMGQGETMAHYAHWLQTWERDNDAFISGHYLPHDGGWERLGKSMNTSYADMLIESGLRNINIVPRIPKVSIGIEYVRDRFKNLVFHKTNLSRIYEFGKARVNFLDAFQQYQYKPLEKGATSQEPLHDINSHPCDALRTYAEGDEGGLVPKSSGMGSDDQGKATVVTAI
tara:strand:+ start:183 stop:1733 length:1551 start_codon:yes stop_codon:yes gene_type:complete